MKEPFEDQDWEGVFRSRLENYEQDPGSETKKSVLGNLPKGKGIWSRRLGVAAIALLLILAGSWFSYHHFFRSEKAEMMSPVLDRNSDAEPTQPQGEKQSSSDGFSAKNKGEENAKKSFLHKNIAEENSTKTPGRVSLNTSGTTHGSVPDMPVSDEENREEFAQNDEIGDHFPADYLTHLPLSDRGSNLILPEIAASKRGVKKTSEKKDLIESAKEEKRWGWYGDILTFWMYQQAKPNTNDDWIVKEMKTPGMLSTDRMGGRLSLGLFYELTPSLELFGGVSSQLQQVRSGFHMRSVAAQDVEFSDAENAFIPRYEDREVLVQEKLWSVGVRSGIRYYLPYGQKNFWFAPSMDYQRLISRPDLAEITTSRDQVYLNLDFGWRHRLSENLYFNFSPALSYSLLQKSESSEIVSLTPYSWGINLGLSYRMRK